MNVVAAPFPGLEVVFGGKNSQSKMERFVESADDLTEMIIQLNR